jgi:hypothetical protein
MCARRYAWWKTISRSILSRPPWRWPLCRGIRARYPEWRYLIDGDGGDENLKDYPIEENPELTIRSVINNPMLYQEGWGVGKIKHSLTYSGGLSRSYTRTYAPGRHFGFHGFSPFLRPSVIAVAEAVPFIELTNYDVPRLYELKGRDCSRGIQALTGLKMPVFPKRRFQHGACRRRFCASVCPSARPNTANIFFRCIRKHVPLFTARAGLDAWIAGQRPARNPVDPLRPYLFFAEDERSGRW